MHNKNPQTIWVKIKIGRRKIDPLLSVDFHGKRMCIEFNTGWVVGVYLEDIDPGPKGYFRGMIVMKSGWDKQYFLQKRTTWKEEEYFELAERLLWEKGIKQP